MIRYLILVLFYVKFTLGFSQGIEYSFSPGVKPYNKYLTSETKITKQNITIDGPKERLERLRSKGIAIQTNYEHNSNSSSILETKNVLPGKGIEAILKYISVNILERTNDEIDEYQSPMAGLLVNGYYNEKNEFLITDITHEKYLFDQSTLDTVRQNFEKADEKIEFPNYPIKIGESFENNTTFDVDLGIFNNLNIPVQILCKFTQVHKSTASFDIQYSISYSETFDETINFTIEAKGGGTGLAKFDLKNNTLKYYHVGINYQVLMNIKDLSSKVKTSISNTLQTVID